MIKSLVISSSSILVRFFNEWLVSKCMTLASYLCSSKTGTVIWSNYFAVDPMKGLRWTIRRLKCLFCKKVFVVYILAIRCPCSLNSVCCVTKYRFFVPDTLIAGCRVFKICCFTFAKFQFRCRCRILAAWSTIFFLLSPFLCIFIFFVW